MPRSHKIQHRFDRTHSPSLRSWEKVAEPFSKQMKSETSLDMGWGRLIFAHTFPGETKVAAMLLNEAPGKRDVAFYLRDPHVVLSIAPQELFLDPSHTYRLWLAQYRHGRTRPQDLVIRRVSSREELREINRIYACRSMIQADTELLWAQRRAREFCYVLAMDARSGTVVGVAAGVDHVELFDDPEQGASLWSLAVDPQAQHPGVGEALVRYLAERFQARGRAFMDLSVLHNNTQAVQLYEKLGFQRVPVFCIKRKNLINEPLYVNTQQEDRLNPYAAIIVREAQRRGLAVRIVDAEQGYFELQCGGRSVLCRESLTELTSAVSMSWCDNKLMTQSLLAKAELNTPDQAPAGDPALNAAFLATHQRVVVKPARGEQGQGISVDIRTEGDLDAAVKRARKFCDTVLIEQMVEGDDLRIIVIGHEVVAAAVRRPPAIMGTGEHSIRALISKQSRRRAAATGGESRIPLDAETQRCVAAGGYQLDEVLPAGERLTVRKAANLHTGGTIHDVTDQLHPALAQAAVKASEVLRMPVVGLDFIVPKIDGPEYAIIEANERPGLANHEPQPTAERFIDLLFPHTKRT